VNFSGRNEKIDSRETVKMHRPEFSPKIIARNVFGSGTREKMFSA